MILSNTDRAYFTEKAFLNWLNQFSTIALTATFFLAVLQGYRKTQNSAESRLTSRTRLAVLSLVFAIILGFVAKAVTVSTSIVNPQESDLIHSLSQVLFWIAIFLIIGSISAHQVEPYLLVAALDLLLEASNYALSLLTQEKYGAAAVASLWLQLTTAGFLFLLTLILCVTHFASGNIHLKPETQPLLEDAGNTAASYDSSPLSVDADESESSDDEEERELKTLRKQKLQSPGGLVEYLCSFKVFLPFLIPYGQIRLQIYFIILISSTLIQRALNVLHPLQLGIIIDKVTANRQIPWKDLFVWIVLQLLASDSTGVEAVGQFLEERLAAWSRQSLNLAAFDRVMSLSMDFHDSKDSGEVIKAIEQAGSLSSLVRIVLLEIVPGILDVVIAMWYISFLFDVYAALIVVAVGIGFTFATFHISIFLTRWKRLLSQKERQESKVLYETIGNWYCVSFFNRKSHEKQRLSKTTNEAAGASVRTNDMYIALSGAQELSEQVGRFAVSVLALYRISIGSSTIGDFVALQSYWQTITLPLYILGHSYRRFSTDLIEAERLLQLFETDVSVKDAPDAGVIKECLGKVEFSNVCFAYGSSLNTLSNISFAVEPGKKIGIAGETGSGKSTMLKVLMRMYDISSGSITIDGQDIKSIKLDTLRDVFGVVPQETVLFNTSILENVRYGRLDATDEDVRWACKAACIHEKIQTLPEGYRSNIGERGVKLSGGERQRIAIARVLLRNSPIVLLDEATSAMDSATESKVQQALKALMHGRTAFVVAHRLSTIVDADLIMVIDHGRVVEQGTHAQLVRVGGKYLELWTKQTSTGVQAESGT